MRQGAKHEELGDKDLAACQTGMSGHALAVTGAAKNAFSDTSFLSPQHDRIRCR
jgi:hypothetical protein